MGEGDPPRGGAYRGAPPRGGAYGRGPSLPGGGAHLADPIDADIPIAPAAFIARRAIQYCVPKPVAEGLTDGLAVQLAGGHWGHKCRSREGPQGRGPSGRPPPSPAWVDSARAAGGSTYRLPSCHPLGFGECPTGLGVGGWGGEQPRARALGAAGLTVSRLGHPLVQPALVEHGVELAALDGTEGGAARGTALHVTQAYALPLTHTELAPVLGPVGEPRGRSVPAQGVPTAPQAPATHRCV